MVIIEDDEDFRFLMGRACERSERFSLVGQAADLPTAVELLTRHRPQVVVTDARLPATEDFAAVRMAREVCPDATIVVLTGLSSDAHLALAHEAGAHHVVEKNAVVRVLVATIADLLVV